MATIVDDDTRRAAVERQMQLVAEHDAVGSHALYHDDAVLEFPQSGERFEGLNNFREWRTQYPGTVGPRMAGSLAQRDDRRLIASGTVGPRHRAASGRVSCQVSAEVPPSSPIGC